MEMNPTLRIALISNSTEFLDLKEEWNELLNKSFCNTIFLRWEWLYNWWLVYRNKSKNLFIITVRDNDKLIGLAPLYIRTRLASYKEVNFLGSNVVCSDYLDFIIDKNREKEILPLILGFISENKTLWDVLDLTDIPSTSISLPIVKLFFKSNKMTIDEEYTICPYINLTSGWDTIYSSYGSILKSTLNKKNKNFKKYPQAHFEELEPEKDITPYFSQFLDLNGRRLQEKGIKNPFLETSFHIFHRNILTELHPKGMAKLNFLKIDNRYIAGIYLLVYNNKYFYYQSGFDPEWKKLSPGSLLFHYCLKSAHEKGIQEFDFLQGNEPYKKYWTKLYKRNARITIFGNSPKGSLKFLLKKVFSKNNVSQNGYLL